jgi:hypothetical protein
MLLGSGLRSQPTQFDVLTTLRTSSRLQMDAIRFARGLCRDSRTRGLLPNPHSLARPSQLAGRPALQCAVAWYCVMRRNALENDQGHE